ncbi:MAG: response regulator transcription factor [Rhodospirillaceae bacterium]|nr:response regulator transcription factor [Rhodospirillaceae bacterium]
MTYPPHILVVDDDTRLRNLLKKFLGENGYMVTAAADAAEARRHMATLQFDLIVVDIMMPGEDGLSLTRGIRAGSAVPILMLTAMGESAKRIHGLEQGVDDYMAKPFEPKELVLRIGSILRRAPPADVPAKSELRLGNYRYDVVRQRLTRAGTPVYLTAGEAELLKVLAQSAGKPVERAALSGTGDSGGNPRTIDVQITRLRRKLEPDTRQPRYLQTVRGTGYILRTDP